MNSTSTKTSTYTLLVLLFLTVCVADNVNETSNNTDLIRDGVLVEDIVALVQRENTVSFQGLDDLIKALDRMKTIEAEVAYLKRKAKEFAKNLLRFESYKINRHANYTDQVTTPSLGATNSPPPSPVTMATVTDINPAAVATVGVANFRALMKLLDEKLDFSADNVNNSMLRIIGILTPDKGDVSSANGFDNFTSTRANRTNATMANVAEATAELLAQLKYEKLQLLVTLGTVLALVVFVSAVVALKSQGCFAESGSYVLRAV